MKDILQFAYGSIAVGSCLFLMAILSMISRPTRWKPWPILRLIMLITPALGTGLIFILPWFNSPSEELDASHLCCLHRCSHSHPYWRQRRKLQAGGGLLLTQEKQSYEPVDVLMMPSNDWVVRIKSRVFKTAQAHRTRCTDWGSSVLFVIEMKGHLPIMTTSRSPRNTKAPPTIELDLRGTMKRLKLFRLGFPKKQRNTISITLTGRIIPGRNGNGSEHNDWQQYGFRTTKKSFFLIKTEILNL